MNYNRAISIIHFVTSTGRGSVNLRVIYDTNILLQILRDARSVKLI
jgi:hypothetical protein